MYSTGRWVRPMPLARCASRIAQDSSARSGRGVHRADDAGSGTRRPRCSRPRASRRTAAMRSRAARPADPLEEAVHHRAPGPERSLAWLEALGEPRHGPLERVAVQVRHAGQDDAGDALGARRVGTDAHAVRSPRSSISSLTASAKPSGSSAVSAQSTGMADLLFRSDGYGRRRARSTILTRPAHSGCDRTTEPRTAIMPTWDSLWTNVNLATMAAGDAPYGAIENGALAVKDGRIAWVGAASDLPHRDAGEVVDGAGLADARLIDCHTHLVFAGDRSGEFEQRLKGVSYEEIARAGGGIARTVAATRQASHSELEDGRAPACLPARRRRDHGRDQVRLRPRSRHRDQDARGRARLGKSHPVDVRTTFLGAHAAKEFANDRAGYLDLVCTQVLPEVAERGLADAVDAFCEGIAFTRTRWRGCSKPPGRSACRSSCTPINSDLGGAAPAARFGALSADHLEYASEQGIQAMAAAGTVAVCCRERSIRCASASSPRSSCCAGMACPSRWPPTAIPAPRPSCRSWPSSTWRAPCSTDARGGAGGGNPACRPGPGAGRSRHARGGEARRSRPLADPSPAELSYCRLRAARTRTPGRPASYPRAAR